MKKNFTKLFLLSLLITAIFSSCTKEDPISTLINNYVKMNGTAHVDSFEIIELSEPDSIFTKLIEQTELGEFANQYKNNVRTIQETEKEIFQIKNALAQINHNLEIIETEAMYAYMGNGQLLGYDRYGNERRGPTLQSLQRLENATINLKAAQNQRKQANSSLNQLQGQYNAAKKQTNEICNLVNEFCNTFYPQYAGKKVVVKCQFKDESGNEQLKDYAVILNDSLTQIVNMRENIIDSTAYSAITEFVSYCKANLK